MFSSNAPFVEAMLFCFLTASVHLYFRMKKSRFDFASKSAWMRFVLRWFYILSCFILFGACWAAFLAHSATALTLFLVSILIYGVYIAAFVRFGHKKA